jgi:hypothetical protein
MLDWNKRGRRKYSLRRREAEHIIKNCAVVSVVLSREGSWSYFAAVPELQP